MPSAGSTLPGPSRSDAAEAADGFATPDSLHHLVRRVLLTISQQVESRIKRHDLTHAQWQPLHHLLVQGPTPVVELARELETDTGAMTRLIDRMERKALCRRVRSTEDRRVVRIELTEDSHGVAAEMAQVVRDVQHQLLAGFSRDELQGLQGLLQRICDNGRRPAR